MVSITDAGVKLLHSASGCIQCVYLTTPSMQLAFNAVPQFLCIETGNYTGCCSVCSVGGLAQCVYLTTPSMQLAFNAVPQFLCIETGNYTGCCSVCSVGGLAQCVYLTTPSMQLAFNAVPQFLCIETGIEFNSTIPTVGGTGSPSVKHNVTLFLAEDGNGKSVIVSAGISTLIGSDLSWLLDTFKSCNPAWRQVRCVVCDPNKCQQVVRTAFPSAHVTCSVWQAASAAASLVAAARPPAPAPPAQAELAAACKTYALALLRQDHTPAQLQAASAAASLVTAARPPAPAPPAQAELAAACKTYALALLRQDHTPAQLQVLKRGILGTRYSASLGNKVWDALTRPGAPLHKLDAWLEPHNYTNILHKSHVTLGTKWDYCSYSASLGNKVWDALTRPGAPLHKLDAWLEPHNYTNILHKQGLERLVSNFSALVRSPLQPDEFVSLFFNDFIMDMI
ncbi:unnamed protein product [Plutella xylostella]|uniref:(diamondback moth) hypothetical protein n=1 Tax=Plutella xylostella TaxID=51655 RepID=A0A8S4G895_PLUXY|nr:unnamed protein product [Plutella xylostella]